MSEKLVHNKGESQALQDFVEKWEPARNLKEFNQCIDSHMNDFEEKRDHNERLGWKKSQH